MRTVEEEMERASKDEERSLPDVVEYVRIVGDEVPPEIGARWV